MGTDIHGVVQWRHPEWQNWAGETMPPSHWCTENHFEDSRNYRVFAALAGVRNGRGFAGIYTHDPIKIIAEPRGFPDDFDKDEVAQSLGLEAEWFMGDHTFSWLTLNEVRLWDGWDQTLYESGILNRQQYVKFTENSVPPESWSGDVWGRDVIVANHDEGDFPDGWNHVRVSWQRPLRDSCRLFLTWIDYLVMRHEMWNHDVRLVFGFDS